MHSFCQAKDLESLIVFKAKASASYMDMDDWLGKRFQQEMDR